MAIYGDYEGIDIPEEQAEKINQFCKRLLEAFKKQELNSPIIELRVNTVEKEQEQKQYLICTWNN